jgi:membrane protein
MLIFLRLLGRSFSVMQQNDPLRMAGATAFFTTFALPPILIILFQIFSLFLGGGQFGKEMMEILSATLGNEGAAQIRRTARGFRTLAQNWYIATGGFIFLLFVATTLFTVIKNSLDDIWNIKVKDKPGILFNLWLRTRSLVVILIAGLLFLAGIVIEGFEALAGEHIEKTWQGGGKYFRGALNEIAGAVIVTTWFIILFRFLADGRPAWKAAIAGGVLTGILYSGGKTLLSTLIKNSNIATIYGASASIVLVLLFVFYSAFILYYGASFIKVYSEAIRKPVQPRNKAYRYQLREVK